MKKIVAVATVVLALAAALVAARAQSAPTAAVRQLSSGGIVRTYRIYRPASAGAHPALVMMLHGGFGTGAAAEGADGWDAAADVHGFVVVYPDGVARAWNAGTCCGQPYERNVDDVAFLTAVIREVGAHDGVDPRRVFVTGLSNGAMMAYRLACEAPVAIAAIGPVAGDLEVPCTAPRGPVSVLAIHGTNDQNVPMAGGYGTKGVSHTEHASVAASLARWRAIDRCDPRTSFEHPPLRTETARCPGGAEVDLIAIEGAGHQWPGSKPAPSWATRLLRLDPPSGALDATTTLWNFFERHPVSSG